MSTHVKWNTLLILILVVLIYQVSVDPLGKAALWSVSDVKVQQPMISGSKWIVVTSIQYPTEDVKRLAAEKGWKVVVVADLKTPKDWNLTNVHFLSIHEQNSMGSFAKSLPFNSYTRKNLGYLYAMMNGAEWIYDTDDDNKPYGLGLNQFDYTYNVGGMKYVPINKKISKKLFNPYQFHGFSNMWPRGFPLEYLGDHNNGENRMIACRQMKTAAVQQGLVHHDPDVDAIFRLQYADKQSGLNTQFNTLAPPISLEAGTYSPWNSQNTLFHYRSFFTMFLPTTVAFRVTDIWRSYFAQKLLHIIGEEVAFYPVNAVQYRNAHNYLKDFSQELDVYEKSGKIVEFLDLWTCSKKKTHECVIELAEKFEEHKFFGGDDTALIKSWTAFLVDIGYEFPKMFTAESLMKQTNQTFGNCRFANIDLGIQPYSYNNNNSFSWETQALNSFGELVDWCKKADNKFDVKLPSPKLFKRSYKNKTGLYSKKDTVLVLINNYPWKKSIGLLQRLYRAFFKTVVFCGNWKPVNFEKEELSILKPINYVNISIQELHEKGHHYNYCVSKVRDLRLQNVTGYYFVADDAVFNIWTVLPLDKPVHPSFGTDKAHWDPKAVVRAYDLVQTKSKEDALIRDAWQEFKFMLNQTKPKVDPESEMKNFTGKRVSDFFYITPSVLNMMAGMSEVFAEAKVFVETTFAKLFNAVQSEKGGPFLYLWGNRAKVYELYNSNEMGIHPLKLSQPIGNLTNRAKFCSTIITAFAKEVYN